jgi:hypothetical protein
MSSASGQQKNQIGMGSGLALLKRMMWWRAMLRNSPLVVCVLVVDLGRFFD